MGNHIYIYDIYKWAVSIANCQFTRGSDWDVGQFQAADVSNPTRPIRTARAWNCQVYEDGDGGLEVAGLLEQRCWKSPWIFGRCGFFWKLWRTYDGLWWLMMTYDDLIFQMRLNDLRPAVCHGILYPTCQEFYAEGDQVAARGENGWILEAASWCLRYIFTQWGLRFCCLRKFRTLKLRLGEAGWYHWWRGAWSAISEQWFWSLPFSIPETVPCCGCPAPQVLSSGGMPNPLHDRLSPALNHLTLGIRYRLCHQTFFIPRNSKDHWFIIIPVPSSLVINHHGWWLKLIQIAKHWGSPNFLEPRCEAEQTAFPSLQPLGWLNLLEAMEKHIVVSGGSWNRGTPSYHPFQWYFPQEKPSIWGYPYWMETSISPSFNLLELWDFATSAEPFCFCQLCGESVVPWIFGWNIRLGLVQCLKTGCPQNPVI